MTNSRLLCALSALGLLFAFGIIGVGCGDETGQPNPWASDEDPPFTEANPSATDLLPPGYEAGSFTENPDDQTLEHTIPSLTELGQEATPLGQTDFVSADANNGQSTAENRYEDGTYAPTADADEDSSFGGESEERTVEEGDIYRVLDGDLILNLNAYRGLQIIDFSDVENPEIIGRLQATGTPVELYVVDDVAYVLMNNWVGYYGSRWDSTIETRDGGMAMAVDLSDPAEPVMIDQSYIPGYIRKSRLTRQGDQAALYVVTGGYDYWENDDGEWIYETRTVVMSFDVSSGFLEKRSQLNLGGYVTDIQATPEALIVARYDWTSSERENLVSLVDISDPAGTMVEGDQVEVAGYIRNQFNMDLYNDVLRVVSAGRWDSGTNHLETFDASDLNNLEPIDSVTFGDGQDLFATLFLGNKAFFVTYMRVDPFHAFYIGDNGYAEEMAEFIVSGWNDFFRAVADETRLIGIGVEDTDGRRMAVSLYDITDLTNPDPLLFREEVEVGGTWSEARWDHRAFSVLEDAVVVETDDGGVETGLILLPVTGWNDTYETYTSIVQIFTFSDNTLTRRGLMNHGTPVRRSFQPERDLTANLSEAQLSLFDTWSPDDPVELGRVDLAPNYTDYFVYGDYAARVANGRDYYYYWWGSRADLPSARVEIVDRDDNPDLADPVATFEVSANARVQQVGDLFLAIDMQPLDTSEWPYTYETTIDIFDLSDPTDPTYVSGFTTDRIQPLNYYYWGWYDWYYPYYGGYGGQGIESVGDSLVFLEQYQENELVGHEETCRTYGENDGNCWGDDGWIEGCTYYSGSINCTSLNGAEPYCTGQILECYYDDESNWHCDPVDDDEIDTYEYCYDYDRYRYWNRYEVEVLDLTDPARPALADTIELPLEDQGLSMLADGTDVWITFTHPYEVDGDSRPYVRYFIRRLGLDNPSSPELDRAINVPGRLLAVDGSTVYTLDTVWGETIVENAVARLMIRDGLAFLQAVQNFPDQQLYSVALDGDDHVLISHRIAWRASYDSDYYDQYQRLTVLDATAPDFDVLAEVDVDSWARLQDAVEGRALFSVPGGLLVMNLEEPTEPYPQAYFATRGWPTELAIVERDIIFAAGRYGIYRFDLDAFNLLDLVLLD